MRVKFDRQGGYALHFSAAIRCHHPAFHPRAAFGDHEAVGHQLFIQRGGEGSPGMLRSEDSPSTRRTGISIPAFSVTRLGGGGGRGRGPEARSPARARGWGDRRSRLGSERAPVRRQRWAGGSFLASTTGADAGFETGLGRDACAAAARTLAWAALPAMAWRSRTGAGAASTGAGAAGVWAGAGVCTCATATGFGRGRGRPLHQLHDQGAADRPGDTRRPICSGFISSTPQIQSDGPAPCSVSAPQPLKCK